MNSRAKNGMEVTRIASVSVGERFSLSGVWAIRPSVDFTYALERPLAGYIGDGVEDTFLIGATPESFETVKVWVDGVLKTLTTDYTISEGSVIFEPASVPAEGAVIEINARTTASATLLAGIIVRFDAIGQNTPWWAWIVPETETVLEVHG